MSFHLLSTTGDLANEDLVLIEDAPRGMGMKSYCMARGVRATPHYPDNAKIYLREENPGIKLSSLLGNTESYLIVSSAMRGVIEQHCQGLEIEYLAFTLYDHRKRVHSRDYCIVNPIGAFDCLDEAASGVKYGKQGSVVKVDKFVLDRNKIHFLPALFRADKEVTEYIVRDDLAQALRTSGFTNVLLEGLDVIG
ncbi:imm11 family protein [Sorangium sp. So ce394]|uniref:imm11 family protein n=1 Tax=Sorangium sp. So ce394 TaxID=3133310 RepID=UPI003F5C8469